MEQLVNKLIESGKEEDFKNLLDVNPKERNYLDFKKDWISDAKLARHILAFSNSDGGLIIFGISENNGTILYEGITETRDPSEVGSRLSKFIPEELVYHCSIFNYDNKKFEVISIPKQLDNIPFSSKKTSSDEISKDKVYIRNNTSSEEASPKMLRQLIKKAVKFRTGIVSSDEFREHIEKLKILYSSISDEYYEHDIPLSKDFDSEIDINKSKLIINNHYPEESFDEFISKCIDIKKNQILRDL